MQPTEIAQQLAGKDDRYLMIVAVSLLVLGGACIIRYLAKFLEKQADRSQSQTDKLIEVVATNTAVIERNTAALDSHTAFFKKEHHQ
jgi:hypothetical protein